MFDQPPCLPTFFKDTVMAPKMLIGGVWGWHIVPLSWLPAIDIGTVYNGALMRRSRLRAIQTILNHSGSLNSGI